MILLGYFAEPDHRFELLFGEICATRLPEPPHEVAVDELNEWSLRTLPAGAARVRVQNSLGIPALDSATLPDVA
jgi:hypothetical protein